MSTAKPSTLALRALAAAFAAMPVILAVAHKGAVIAMILITVLLLAWGECRRMLPTCWNGFAPMAAVLGLWLAWMPFTGVGWPPHSQLETWARVAFVLLTGLWLCHAVSAFPPGRADVVLRWVAGALLATLGGVIAFLLVHAVVLDDLDRARMWFKPFVLSALPLVPLVVAWAWGRHRRCALALAVVCIVLVLLAKTAVLALAMAAAAAVLVLIAPHRSIRALAVGFAVLLLTMPVTVQATHHQMAVRGLLERIPFSAAHRILIWDFVAEKTFEAPFWGWGLDASRSLPGGHAIVVLATGQGEQLPLHPHNAALQVFVELGAPGALLFAALLGLAMISLDRIPARGLRAGAAATATAYLFVMNLSFGIWQFWWICTLFYGGALAILVVRTIFHPEASVRVEDRLGAATDAMPRSQPSPTP